MLIEFKVGKVKASSTVKKSVYKEKRHLYLDRILITKSIQYEEIDIGATYILQLPTLQELSTSMTFYKRIERSARSVDLKDCATSRSIVGSFVSAQTST